MKKIIITALTALVANTAVAATFTFDSNNNSNAVPPTTVDGITLTFSAPLTDQQAYFANDNFNQNDRGIGVRTNPGSDPSDAINEGETLRLSFDTVVAGDTLTAGRWGNGDSLTITADNGNSLVLDTNLNPNHLEFLDISSLGNFTWLDMSSNVIGNDGSTLHAVSVSAVPVPAAAWLFGSAMLGLAGVARKKRTTS